MLLSRSVKKYGWEAHKFEIIEECAMQELNKRERHWQDFYDVLNGGLNCKLTKCEDKNGKLSEATKEKISKSLMGHIVTEKTKKSSSIANKGNKYCLGYTHTPEFIKSLQKKVDQFDKSGNFIKSFDSIKQAATELEISAKQISNCVCKLCGTAGGFIWKYNI